MKRKEEEDKVIARRGEVEVCVGERELIASLP